MPSKTDFRAVRPANERNLMADDPNKRKKDAETVSWQAHEIAYVKQVVQREAPDKSNQQIENAIEQCKQFTEATAVNALALTKLDGTAKGGVVIGISDQFRIPVKYIGVGEGMDHLQLFDRKAFVDSLFKQ